MTATGWGEVIDEGRAPAFGLICMGVWLNAADALVTSTIMPSVGRALGGFAWFGWASGLYLLASVAAGASAGLVAQRFGLRRATAAAALVYAAGCALGAGGGSIGIFLTGRLLQGLGGGWVAGLCSAAIGLMFPDRTLPRVYAVVTSIWGVASLIGPLIGGLFANFGEWRWAFWSFAIQGVVVAAASLVFLPAGETGRTDVRMAWPQLGLITLGVGAMGAADFTLPLASGALMAAGGALLVAVLVVDRRSPNPLLPRAAADLTGPVGAGMAAQFLLNAGTMGYSVYGPALLQRLAGLKPLAAGYVIAAEAVAWTAAGLTVAGLTGRWAARAIRAGGVVIIAGAAASAWAFPLGRVTPVAVSGALLGGGFGLSFAFTSQRILAALVHDERTLGAAAMNTVRLTGSAAGAALCAAAANLCGVSQQMSVRAARLSGVWVMLAGLPLAFGGVVAIWRVARAGAAPAVVAAAAQG